MRMMSIREFSANISHALAHVEAGEDIVLTRDGKSIVRITRERVDDEAKRQEAIAKLRELIARGVDFGGPFTYDERTGR